MPAASPVEPPGAMVVGMRYVVTQASEDGEFEVGDHIELASDGAILNREAGGWMAAEDVPHATRGMRVRKDEAWRERQVVKAIAVMEKLTPHERKVLGL